MDLAVIYTNAQLIQLVQQANTHACQDVTVDRVREPSMDLAGGGRGAWASCAGTPLVRRPAIGAVIVFISLFVSIVLLNSPRAAVPPHLRGDLGLLAEWAGRKRAGKGDLARDRRSRRGTPIERH